MDLGNLVTALLPAIEGRPLSDAEIGKTFRLIARSVAHFDNVVVFAYRAEDRPIDLYDTFDAPKFKIHVTDYQIGPYLLDPFFHAARARRNGFWRMRELAPDRFFAGEYYRTYYSETHLAEEVGFFVPLSADIALVLSLMRLEESGTFSRQEADALKTIAPLVAAVVRTSWTELGQRFDRQRAPNSRPEAEPSLGPATRAWVQLGLTGREAAIVDLVLRGHSSEAIGLRLGISTGTVKVHRRNVYRKLGISSQTQLFSLYLSNV